MVIRSRNSKWERYKMITSELNVYTCTCRRFYLLIVSWLYIDSILYIYILVSRPFSKYRVHYQSFYSLSKNCDNQLLDDMISFSWTFIAKADCYLLWNILVIIIMSQNLITRQGPYTNLGDDSIVKLDHMFILWKISLFKARDYSFFNLLHSITCSS